MCGSDSVAPQPFVPSIRLRERAARAGWSAAVPFRRAGCLVFTYHRISTADDPFPHLDVAVFRRQLEWLGRHCTVVAPDRVRTAASAPATTRPPVLLTFDDGYRSFHDVVAPLLREFGMPGVVFVITDYADRPRPLPWDQRHRPSDVSRQTMTWNEIRATRDIATAGAHTHTHPRLSTVSADQIDEEIRISRDRLAAETGVTPTFFAYPHGDVATDARASLTRHGFETAFTTAPGVNDTATDWLAANRVGIGEILPTRWMTTQTWTLTTR